MGGRERRRHKRYHVMGLRQRLVKPLFFGLFTKPTSEEYPCLDISESGLQFISRKMFTLHDRLLINITTPTTRKDPIRVKARVIWVRRSLDLSFCLVGAEFISLNKRQRSALKMLVEKCGRVKEEISAQGRDKITKEATVYLRLPPKS